MRNKGIIAGLFVLVLLLVPTFVHSSLLLHLILWTCLITLVVMGMRFTSLMGEVSFAQPAFMAVGAYSSVLLMRTLSIGFGLSFFLALLIGLAVALPLGYALLKPKGVYFFLLTFAFGEIVRLFLLSFREWSGGSQGLYGIPNPVFTLGKFSIEIASRTDFYYFILIMAVIVIIALFSLEKSWIGRIFRTIKEQDVLAESIGVNLLPYKLMAFVIGSLCATLAGVFYAYYMQFINPDSFGFSMGLNLLMALVIGGTATIAGPIIGSAFVVVIPQVANIAPNYQPFITGGLIIIVLIFMPEGLSGQLSKVNLNRINLKMKGIIRHRLRTDVQT